MSAPDPFAPHEPLRFLVGATAVGKSELALALAEELDAVVVGLDSMQVYRGMDVGTAKSTAAERARVPHACIDLVEPSEAYDVSRYVADALAALEAVRRAGKRALFVGGTGLYLKALVHGLWRGPRTDPALRARWNARAEAEGSPALHAELVRADPASARRIHPHDRKRVVRALEVLEQTGRPLSEWQREWGIHGAGPPPRAARIVGLELPRPLLLQRIAERTRAMLDGGWIEEVVRIRDGGGFGATAIQALGYREVLAHASGELPLAECEARIVRLTARFTRRQATWFRSFPGIRWIDPGNATARAEARAVLEPGLEPRLSGS